MDWLISLLAWHEAWAYALAWALAGAIGAALCYPFVKRLGQSFWRIPLLLVPILVLGQLAGMGVDGLKSRYEADILMQQLRQQALFATILDMDPAAAGNFRSAYDEQVKEAPPEQKHAAMRALGASFIGRYFEAQLMKAPDDSIMRMVTHLRQALDALKGKPASCVNYLMGNAGFVLTDLPAGLRQAELDMKADVIASGMRNPAPAVAAPGIREGMAGRLQAKYRELGFDVADIDRFFELEKLPPETGCTVAIHLFAALASLDPRDTGELMRVISGKPVDAI